MQTRTIGFGSRQERLPSSRHRCELRSSPSGSSCGRTQVIAFFGGLAAVPGGHGSVCHSAPLGTGVEEARSRGPADAGQGCEGLRQAQQERCRRCRGDLRGGVGDPPMRFVTVKTVEQQGPIDAAPSARQFGASAHATRVAARRRSGSVGDAHQSSRFSRALACGNNLQSGREVCVSCRR